VLRLALLAHGLFVLVCELYSVHYFSLFLSYKVRTMTDVESTKCGGRALVVGHGFVKRLVRVVRSGERKIRRHDIKFWGFPGENVSCFMQKVSGWDLSKFCTVYVELGTNALCGWRSAEAVVQDLLHLVQLLQERGAAKVVLGEILYRSKMRKEGPSVENFKAKVNFVNSKLRDRALVVTALRVWSHKRVRSASCLSDDGVHLTDRDTLLEKCEGVHCCMKYVIIIV